MAAAPSPRDDLTDEVPSKRLEILAQQLRLYKPIPATTAIMEEGIGGGGLLSQQMASGCPSASFAQKNTTFINRSAKRAAVLVCLFEGDDGELRVILTKRSANLSSHSGEVSLPGGKAEEGDANDAATALREAKEEIGLDPSSVTVVAVLEPFLSKHLLRVAPVVCILPNKESFTPSANKSEVDAIFDAPLEMFLKNEKRRWEEREWLGLKFLVHFFDFQCEKGEFMIWGLTAQILIRTASIVFQRPPDFVEQSPEFHVLNQREDVSLL
ncbi:Nudix hydrolase 15 [Nymphaea thermarum]|nr:Nudix hydrolase 15 [Nymphaea thermarum]